jgi:RNA polymerase sigma factor (sigma-70 family)
MSINNNYGVHIKKYMGVISGSEFEPMTKEQERTMLSDPNLTKKEKTDILVQRNIRLISSVAKKYTAIAEMDDMMQEGIVGLYRAAEAFDTTKNIKFCTYAYWHVIKSIQEYLKTENKSFSSIRNQSMLSFNYTNGVDTDRDNGNCDKLASEVSESTYSEPSGVYHDVNNNEKNKLIENLSGLVMSTDILDDREKTIIQCRFLSPKPMTLMQVGKKIGLSHSMVKLIGDRAVAKLEKHLTNSGLCKEDFLQSV